MGIGKTSVYRPAAVARQVPAMKREKLLGGYKTKAVGADGGGGVTGSGAVGVAVDAINGMVLSIDELAGEDAEQLKTWL